MLIRAAGVHFGAPADVRIEGERIAEIGQALPAREGEPVVEAAGAALIPGLHDHHLHLLALAAARVSLACGPPQVTDAIELVERIRAAPGVGWLRGIGYHESVAGNIDRGWLDQVEPARPIRIQHRGGRRWILNSAALEALGDTCPQLDVERGWLDDADDWLRERLHGTRLDLSAISRELAAWGVAGVTDAGPRNGRADAEYFAAAQARGEFLQDLVLMGDRGLDRFEDTPRLRAGARKLHLHEPAMPDFDWACAAVRAAHEADRVAAFHCVTRAELVFALGVLDETGILAGDRIEHASVVPPELLARIVDMDLTIVTQPHFVAERGDQYLAAVAADDQPWLYRLRGFKDAGLALAAGSDAPFGAPDPWAAMQAAVDRQTAAGVVMEPAEALTPEQALDLYTSDSLAPGRRLRAIEPGARADLCLLDRPWVRARTQLSAVRPRLVLRAGEVIHLDPRSTRT